MKRCSPLLLISTLTIYTYPWKLLSITTLNLSSVVNCCVGDTGAPDLTSLTFTSMASETLLMYRPLAVRSVCVVPEPTLAAIPRCVAGAYPNNNAPPREAMVRLIISFIGIFSCGLNQSTPLLHFGSGDLLSSTLIDAF